MKDQIRQKLENDYEDYVDDYMDQPDMNKEIDDKVKIGKINMQTRKILISAL